jgi:hypothetical protein
MCVCVHTIQVVECVGDSDEHTQVINFARMLTVVQDIREEYPAWGVDRDNSECGARPHLISRIACRMHSIHSRLEDLGLHMGGIESLVASKGYEGARETADGWSGELYSTQKSLDALNQHVRRRMALCVSRCHSFQQLLGTFRVHLEESYQNAQDRARLDTQLLMLRQGGLSATERENLSLEYHLDPPLLLNDTDQADGAQEGQAVVVVDMDDGIEEVTISSGHSTSAPVKYV